MSTRAPTALLEDPIHFVGIGGSGMSGLAEIALCQGHRVQGSDLKSSPAIARLTSMGAKIDLHHAADLVGKARTIVYSSAIRPANAELTKARELGLRLMHRADFLNLLMQGKQAITVAGTHGKSTTSAMITHVLDSLGADPSAAIGGSMLRYGSPARIGKSSLFVAEADESDGSFLKYSPYVGVLTNIDQDHMEFFKDQAGIQAAFQAYLANIDDEGMAIIGWDNPFARMVGSAYEGSRLTYGFLIGCEVRGVDYRCENGETTFTAVVERDIVKVRMKTMGRHNAQNALAALAVVRALELDVVKAAASLVDFQGVERRMAHVYAGEGVRIFDDYAHNPGKIAACIESLKDAWPKIPLHVVFQAHRYSRLETMYDDMLGALTHADFVYVVPVYSAGETTTEDFSPKRIARDLVKRFGTDAVDCKDLNAAVTAVHEHARASAVILTVGAGDVWQVAEGLKIAYSRR